MRRRSLDERANDRKVQWNPEGCDVDPTAAWREGHRSYLGRSRLMPERATRSGRFTEREVSRGRSVRWAAHESGGLKSLRCSDEEHRIQMAGVTPRRPATKGAGGQGVRSDLESEGFEEKYRAVINGGYPEDEQVGQRWGKVEPALWGQRRSHSPIVPRCLLMARYGRFMCDPRRPAAVPVMSRVSDPIRQNEMGSDAAAGVGGRSST
jgi:hypothetical protein